MHDPITPVTPRDVKAKATPALVLAREVLSWTTHGGTYGMGGPGFLGFELAPGNARPREWLLLTLWSAGDWVLANKRWVTASPEQYAVQRPWSSYYGGDRTWDELGPLIVGKWLTRFSLWNSGFELIIGDVVFTFSDDPKDRPIYTGTGEPRVLPPKANLHDAWILADKVNVMTR